MSEPGGLERVTVMVPATSANLGVGFDTLGMALDLWASFTFARSGTLEIHGCEPQFTGPDNLAWTSFLTACESLGTKAPTCSIEIGSPIPLSGGLGSSSTCVVAGVIAAQALSGRPVDQAFTLDVATQIEGHPDNVAPAVLGGLVSSFIRDGKTVSSRFDVAPNLRFIVAAPPYQVRTVEARKVMPREVPLETTVWQMGRCVATVLALEAGDARLFGEACQDRLHEPYRKALIPDYEPLRSRAMGAGAVGFFISGSGSTMIAVADGDEMAERVIHALGDERPDLWLREVAAIKLGAHLAQAAEG